MRCAPTSTITERLAYNIQVNRTAPQAICWAVPEKPVKPVPLPTRRHELASRFRRISRKSDPQQRDALNKFLPSPSPLALFEDTYLVTNVNCSGDEGRLANSENRFALVNYHGHIL